MLSYTEKKDLFRDWFRNGIAIAKHELNKKAIHDAIKHLEKIFNEAHETNFSIDLDTVEFEKATLILDNFDFTSYDK